MKGSWPLPLRSVASVDVIETTGISIHFIFKKKNSLKDAIERSNIGRFKKKSFKMLGYLDILLGSSN